MAAPLYSRRLIACAGLGLCDRGPSLYSNPPTSPYLRPAAREQAAEARDFCHAQPPRRSDQPVPAPAPGQPGALAAVGRGGARRGREQDKPILLSVGYAACHWCHVMAHESFENPDDRRADEQRLRQHQGRSRGAARPRPDLPACAGAARPAGRLAADHVPDARRRAVLGRHLLPAGIALRPARPAGGAAGRRQDLARGAPQGRQQHHARSRRRCSASPGPSGRPAARGFRAPEPPRRLAQAFDTIHGGLGGAPKFPQAPLLDLLWRQALRERRCRPCATPSSTR